MLTRHTWSCATGQKQNDFCVTDNAASNTKVTALQHNPAAGMNTARMHCVVQCRPQLTEGALPQGLPIQLFAAAHTEFTYNEIERFFQDSQPADSSVAALCCCTYYHI